jgi:hypothetical protein
VIAQKMAIQSSVSSNQAQTRAELIRIRPTDQLAWAFRAIFLLESRHAKTCAGQDSDFTISSRIKHRQLISDQQSIQYSQNATSAPLTEEEERELIQLI